MPDLSSIEIPAMLPITFHHQGTAGVEAPVVIFLHGYTDSARAVLRRTLKGRDLPFNILAPNGPFPLPVRAGDHFKEAYAWYFWDLATNRMVIHPEVAVQILTFLIGHLGYEKSPKLLVGFSQGGFLMPYLFPKLANLKGMIGIGCNYRLTSYHEKLVCPLIAIHGAKDEVVPLGASQQSYEELMTAKGATGEYYVLSEMGHSVDQKASDLLIQKIVDILK